MPAFNEVNVKSNRFLNSFVVLALLLFYTPSLLAGDLLVDRRKDQFPDDSGRLIAPLPYSMPGIGKGFFILGHFANLFSTTGDLTIVQATGEIKGTDVNFDEIPIIKHHVFIRAEFLKLSSVQTNYYDARGMNTSKDDYSLLDISSYKSINYGLDLTFNQRRFTFSLDRNKVEGELDTIRDPDGVVITEFADPYKFDSFGTTFSIKFDMTDDYQDPKKGVRLNISYQNHPAQTKDDPDFYTTDVNLSMYLPLLKTDTLVFNLFQSDAHVRTIGNIDRTAIAQELGFNCAPTDTQCLSAESSVIDNFVNGRSHGTATSLGGLNRLRAYSSDRFNGASSATIGAEYRMNFVREATPFNYSLMKDTHTGYQVAVFTAVGSVAESSNQLWDDTRSVYGAGVRLVTGSGSVYRFDLAMGDEGLQPNLFFYYPWN